MFGMGRMTWWGTWIILNEVSDRVKISDLRSKVPLYGVAFDYAITALQMAGLIRIVKEGSEEYVELTELGKNVKNWYTKYPLPPPGPWYPPGFLGWGWGGWGWRKHWRWWWDW